jgi:hypothetical protein
MWACEEARLSLSTLLRGERFRKLPRRARCSPSIANPVRLSTRIHNDLLAADRRPWALSRHGSSIPEAPAQERGMSATHPMQALILDGDDAPFRRATVARSTPGRSGPGADQGERRQAASTWTRPARHTARSSKRMSPARSLSPSPIRTHLPSNPSKDMSR